MSTQSIQPMANQFTYFPVPFHLQNAYQVPQAAVQPVLAPVVYPTLNPLPQVQQLIQAQQQLLQKDAQILTPEAIASVKVAIANTEIEQKLETKRKAVPRKAAGQTWDDPTLANWPENDFRLFCGDLGNEVNDDVLTRTFSKYPSFNMARVVREKWTGKTKGYGFVSFANASDMAAALKEMNGKYVGNRPIKLRKSTWKNRIDYDALEKAKSQPQKKLKLQKKSILHK
ncbi:RNA-binding protein 42 [Rhynchospora pubera]|uniref:RNA-binding protein 42 n=1 Tax=Rhynchospora pubera TaxID=906938 RepID=A0AAV8H890_9POAL|nr:RNA-binding protein 42 [Rhynchospora pubera]